jgi:hypothetical protein
MTAVFYCHPERSEGSLGFQQQSAIITVRGIPAYRRAGFVQNDCCFFYLKKHFA